MMKADLICRITLYFYEIICNDDDDDDKKM